jgi:flagellar biosynthesis/type III secretory pathway ATPase
MCAVSNVGDYYQRQWQQPQYQQFITNPVEVTRADFEALKREVMEMKDLLIKAKEIDVKTGQKDCEMEHKIALLKKMAEVVGISLEDVFHTGPYRDEIDLEKGFQPVAKEEIK